MERKGEKEVTGTFQVTMLDLDHTRHTGVRKEDKLKAMVLEGAVLGLGMGERWSQGPE